MNNKENLLETALTMFAKRGYSAVSVRDICSALGLKEGSLYYHYKNKEDLLCAMYALADALILRMKAAFGKAFREIEDVRREEMCAVAVNFLREYFCDSHVSRILSMLMIERMNDPKAFDMFERFVYTLPTEQCAGIFRQMAERGIIRHLDANRLAWQYCSIVFSIWLRDCSGIASEDTRRKRHAEQAVAEEIGFFYDNIRRDDDHDTLSEQKSGGEYPSDV